jgi:hypothetical protein
MPVRLDDAKAALAREAWVDFVTERPIEYLRMRWQMMTYQIGLGGNNRNVFIGGMIPNPYGIEAAFPDLFAASTEYQLSFGGGTSSEAGVVHRLWPLLILSTVAGGAAVARRRGSPYAIDALLSAFASLVLIFFVAPQVHFRYVSPLYVVLGISCLGLMWPWFRGRHADDGIEVAAPLSVRTASDEAPAVSPGERVVGEPLHLEVAGSHTDEVEGVVRTEENSR